VVLISLCLAGALVGMAIDLVGFFRLGARR
jgi:hypothetical protein